MHAETKKFDDWLMWFTAIDERLPQRPFRLANGMDCAASGHMACATSPVQGRELASAIASEKLYGMCNTLGAMLAAPPLKSARMKTAYIQDRLGLFIGAMERACSECGGTGKIVHVCGCDYCTAKTEPCGCDNGREVIYPDDIPVWIFGVPFVKNRLQYGLVHAPEVDEVTLSLIEINELGERKALRIVCEAWTMLIAQAIVNPPTPRPGDIHLIGVEGAVA